MRSDQAASRLERLFNPRSIALVGASGDGRSISGQPLRHLQSRGYAGRIYPVNPKHERIGGLPAYPSVLSLPEVPDLAVILVGAARAVAALTDCGTRGIPYAIVIGSGFAETGAEGARLQADLVAVAAAHGVRLIGPNCQGMMNLADNVFAGFGPAFANSALRTGPVSLVTQSGGFGYAVVNMAEQEGVGFRRVVSTGNEADVTSLDLLDDLVDDPGTAVIAAYSEGMKDARRLLAVGRRALRARKPVLIWKVGNSDAGRRAAASHTANLGGANELYGAAFDQLGWIRIDDVQELVDYTAVFLRGKLPDSDDVGIVTVSGGAGVLMADGCAARGLAVPALSPATRRRLRDVLPAFASPENPVDVTATILNQPDLLRAALGIIVDDPRIGSLLVAVSSVEAPLAAAIAEALVELDRQTGKPVLVSWSARDDRVGDAYERLRMAAVPLYRTPTRCARAVAALCHFAGAVRRFASDEAALAARPAAAQSTIGNGGGRLNEFQAKRWLADYGLQPTAERLVGSAAAAARAAAEIGFPVALKVQSPDIPHKTEVGGVRLGLGDPAAVAAAYEALTAQVARRRPDARLDGVLVQEMVDGGIETILGLVNDERFGPALMFGLGGIFTEVLGDVVFRFAPLTPAGARRMIDAIRGRAILDGVRGRPPADIEALVDAVVRLSQIAEDAGDRLVELDINPLVVLPRGRGVRVVDALLTFRPEDDAGASRSREVAS